MSSIRYLTAALFFMSSATFAQTGGELLRSAYQKRNEVSAQSPLKNYPVKSVGPVVQGGRVSDIEVSVNNPNEYLVAYASGGIFKTVTNGITFKPIFDEVEALGIGDMAMAPSDNNIIYVGTGEKNSSRSSYAGSGVYKSADGGETWSFIGLEDSQHIGRVIVHPTNPDMVWVASLGALYTHNDNRGVFKSADGGKTWKKTLFVNDSTGIVDLVINPKNPDQLWAAAWERERKAWNFKGNGPGSGIYRSDDGGDTWFRTMDGFPNGSQVGRIGLAVSTSEPNIVYAFLDNQAQTKEERKKEEGVLTTADVNLMTKEQFMVVENDKLAKFLKSQGYPKKYTAKSVKKDIKEGKYDPKSIANYFGDANAALFNTSVVGAELYRSDDSGSTWKKMNGYDLNGVYFTYGYYFGEVRVAPDNSDKVYIFGVPLLKSNDGGVNYARIDTLGDVHVDHQTLWINPQNSKHLRLGNDGGLYESYDEGANWNHLNNMSVGQFYTVNVDMEKPYNIYGGLQDNGSLVGSSKSVPNRSKKWERVFGGDGMFIEPDVRDPNIVYTGFQFGNYYRINRSSNDRTRITPQHDIGEPTLRFNWRTPLKLSIHNQDIVYIGAQKLYRSFNQGDDWEAISPDLTYNKPQGNVPYSTISTFSESPLDFGLIYAGTDDGRVHVTKGNDWQEITNGLPSGKWVSSVVASPHDKATVFVTLNGYRADDFKFYAYKSTNYGESWTSVKANLPNVVVNDLIQDPVNPDLLYIATDNATYVSLNGGDSWDLLNGIPNVASYDLIVHPRENELVVGTHGRSIYVVDVKPLQKVAGKNQPLFGFAKSSIKHNERWGEKRYPYSKPFDPSIDLSYYTSKSGSMTIEITDNKGIVLRKLDAQARAGFGSKNWDLKIQKPQKRKKKVSVPLTYAAKGKYKIKFTMGEHSDALDFEVK